ncbi:hypothetical protein B9Z55_019716 [Caenorhabditis nigoni]|uniref:Uncharacterized protein n=1 Tax=Caenorhabditis nigoni TaxID=1611254 RepID=A0A2G5TJJ4_9PELO|nr:hypothetical protein B9Z55_019716 [Caenorhabditis nigoni]
MYPNGSHEATSSLLTLYSNNFSIRRAKQSASLNISCSLAPSADALLRTMLYGTCAKETQQAPTKSRHTLS